MTHWHRDQHRVSRLTSGERSHGWENPRHPSQTISLSCASFPRPPWINSARKSEAPADSLSRHLSLPCYWGLFVFVGTPDLFHHFLSEEAGRWEATSDPCFSQREGLRRAAGDNWSVGFRSDAPGSLQNPCLTSVSLISDCFSLRSAVLQLVGF